MFVVFDCLEDDFCLVDCDCNILCYVFFCQNSCFLERNAIDFSFSTFDFKIGSSCLILNTIVCRFKFGILAWIETKPCHEEGKYERSNETSCFF